MCNEDGINVEYIKKRVALETAHRMLENGESDEYILYFTEITKEDLKAMKEREEAIRSAKASAEADGLNITSETVEKTRRRLIVTDDIFHTGLTEKEYKILEEHVEKQEDSTDDGFK